MIRGTLFSRYYLDDGIREAADYAALDTAAFTAATGAAWRDLQKMRRPSEAETEHLVIVPVLNALGWRRLPQQAMGRDRRDISDAVLFPDAASLTAALEPTGQHRFRLGTVVTEFEARDTPLDRASGNRESPAAQILRYLAQAHGRSDGKLAWGLLTNGRLWRLYWVLAPNRAEGFVEIDLPGLLELPPPTPAGAPPDHWLRVFILLFRAAATTTRPGERDTFLAEALAEGRRYQSRVTAELSRQIFDRVFPQTVHALAASDPRRAPADPAWREELREAALRFLFRLLFLFYAEDRDLLPLGHPGYRNYSLRLLREQAERATDGREKLAARLTTWWPKLAALFAAIDKGSDDLGLPQYNGKLFDDAPGALLVRTALPDATLVPLIDALSREGEGLSRRWINYRDLSVQQLGSIYEQLLERDVVEAPPGVALRPNAFARRTTGSYYTPDELVQLILRRAIGPLLVERRARFDAEADRLAHDRRARRERIAELARHDPAEAFLALRVCDPAMGSGHFLVALVDYLASETLLTLSECASLEEWPEYRSPLTARMETIRTQIRGQAQAHGWPVREEQLDDRHIVRRIILKRVIYGVDLNPMAVELAKLSLWLHSFTVGAPLSFLDHHLRCGDSLFGEFAGPVLRDFTAEFGVFIAAPLISAQQAAAGMTLIEQETDADIAGVQSSERNFATVEEDTAALRAFLDIRQSDRWLPAATHAAELGRKSLFAGTYGDIVAIAAGAPPRKPADDAKPFAAKRGKPAVTAADAHAEAASFLVAARSLAAERRFLHWEAAFPGVWQEWERERPFGGFDAVIGNPPWDRMKMQEVEWFAARLPEVALHARKSDRRRAIAKLRKASAPTVADYDQAAAVAKIASQVARTSGAYPLLGRGDINLYSLMVERAARLIHVDGIVGMLTPSGIAADLSAAAFFRSISTAGRLTMLFDFENRKSVRKRRRRVIEPPSSTPESRSSKAERRRAKLFFPSVDSRQKFSALAFGGENRKFETAACAFFKRSATAAEREAFALTPEDFRAVNPNTGTAPIFRTERDAAITKAIYGRLPVLVNRSFGQPRAVWPVRYHTMFHMTNDSGKFRTAAELRKLGAYELKNGTWEKATARWLPLYEGKMVQAYDHRAASVVVNPENIHRPAQPEPAGDLLHQDPNFRPKPQFWVSERDDSFDQLTDCQAVLGYKDVTAPTNVRTMIAALIPKSGFGNTVPLLLPDSLAAGESLVPADPITYRKWACLLLANLNAFVLDYVARQKVQGQHLNFFIVEQLPVVPPETYRRKFGPKTAEQLILEDVLALTCTAHDLDAFARDLGHQGPPFPWNPEDRLRRRARLDALFFLLYGIDRDDADYILGTFPIVREQEQAAYQGRFRSRDLILAFMAALQAGHPEAPLAG